MTEKDIFNIVDYISDDDLSKVMGKTYTIKHIDNSVNAYEEKEMIRARLHEKIKMDEDHQPLSQKIINNQDIPIINIEDTGFKLKRGYKKGTASKKNSTINKLIQSLVAAMFVFIVSVNVFPDLALALDNIPVLNKLVKAVSFDKGFNNVIASGNIQEVTTTIEDKGAKFTVTTIVGDDLKLWIGYELEGENLMLGEIVKFKNQADGKDLRWIGYTPNEDKNYIEVHMDRLVKDFKMEVDIYTDDPSFHTRLTELDEKAISDMQQLFEKNKITTLNVPISLNDNIYNDDLRVLNILGKEFKSEIGTFKIVKLELAESRSRVYCKLVSDEYELADVLVPRLIDGEGKNYSSPTDSSFYTENNTLCLELNGGIKSTEGLSFTCNGLKYVKKKDKHIIIDLNNNRIEPNNLGISLNNIEDSNITLNVPKNAVEFEMTATAKNEKGNTVVVKDMRGDGSLETVMFRFKELNAERIIISVNSVEYGEPRGFDMKLVD